MSAKLFPILLFLLPGLPAQEGRKIPYTVPPKPWAQELGNHRALLQVAAPAPAVRAGSLTVHGGPE